MKRDWIEAERIARQRGKIRPLEQSEHDAVNARYPGCTLQYCESCGEPTGKSDGEAICETCALVEWELDRQYREESE